MTKYNPQIFDKLVKARAKGHTIEQCAFLAGIHRITLHRWLSLGLQGEQPFQAFYRRFEKGKAHAAGVLLDTLYDQALEGCRASAFFLLDRVYGFPKNAPPPVQITIEGSEVDINQDIKTIRDAYAEFGPAIDGPVIDLDEQ